jgi:phosphate transport system substrate-binding protein
MRFILPFIGLLLFTFVSFAKSKDVIRVTGSASVYPIVSYIYENSNLDIKKSFKKNPIIESVGTGAGFDALCKQVFSSNSPDVVSASRQITSKEIENCKNNGIVDLQKITLGIDGIVIGFFHSDKTFANVGLTIEDLQRALSKYIVINGQVMENKITNWNGVRDGLPKSKIVIYGPNSNSGTFDFFREVIQKECASNKQISHYIQSIGKNVKDECGILRRDVYFQMPDQDTAISRKVELQKGAIGILRFSFFENSGKFNAIPINGVEVNEGEIISGKYKLSRHLYLYYDASYLNKVEMLREFLTQIAKFSYRDLMAYQNEYNNTESSSVVLQYKNNKAECILNRKIIGFEFNCGKNG